jgi:Na+-exporting ATPase
MVLKKVWIPTASAFVDRGMRAPYDTVSGQSYTVESGREYVRPLIISQLLNVPTSPFYPRGIIRALNPGGTDTTPEEDLLEEDDMTAEDVVHIDNLEPGFQELVQSAALNNMAILKRGEEGKNWEAIGDPTEVAIQVFAHKVGHGKPHL